MSGAIIASSRPPLFDEVFQDGSLTSIIRENTIDPWVNTNFKGYVHMSPHAKGEFGERFITILACQEGHDVKHAHSATAGHDRIINGMKIEIKFSLATRVGKRTGAKVQSDYGVITDSFIINHVSKGKDWDRLLFCGINPREKDKRFIWFTRADFTKYVESGTAGCFKIQQGGKKIKNDDYMCTDIKTLMKCDWVHMGIKSAFTK